MQWATLDTATEQAFEDRLGARYGHTALALPGGQVLVTGGKTAFRTDPLGSMPLWLLDLESQSWSVRTVEGPCVRWGHCTALLRQGVLLFGGLNSTYNLRDVWLLDASSEDWAWSPLELEHMPSVRGYASAVAVQSRHGASEEALVFGGLWCHGGPYEYNNELVLLQPDAEKAQRPLTTGQPPSPRAQHAAVSSSALGGRHMLIAGGGDSRALLADVHALCLEGWHWSKLACLGNSPFVEKALQPRDFRITPLRCCALPAQGHLLVLSEHRGKTQAHALRLARTGQCSWSLLKRSNAPAWRPNGAAVWLGSALLHLGGHQQDFTKVDRLSFGPALRWRHLKVLLLGLQEPKSPLHVLPELLLRRICEFLRQPLFMEDLP